MLTVEAFTAGPQAAGARFRVRQYIGLLRDAGIALTEHPAQLSAYPPSRRLLRPLWAGATLAQRLPALLASRRADVTLLQRALLSTYVTLEPLSGAPRVLDVDDALWAHPRGDYARKLAGLCASVICGNDFLAEHFGRWNATIDIVATGVDTARFRPAAAAASAAADQPFTIGWSGGASGLPYLYAIEEPLARVLRELPSARLLVMCDAPPILPSLDPARVLYVPWSEEVEVRTLQRMDVGLMPLDDSVWTRGKCSYKMLLYMSCGRPVVVSPVGMNRQVLQQGAVGFAAASTDAWVDALLTLAANPAVAHTLGAAGRRVVESTYALEVTGAQLARSLHRYS